MQNVLGIRVVSFSLTVYNVIFSLKIIYFVFYMIGIDISDSEKYEIKNAIVLNLLILFVKLFLQPKHFYFFGAATLSFL